MLEKKLLAINIYYKRGRVEIGYEGALGTNGRSCSFPESGGFFARRRGGENGGFGWGWLLQGDLVLVDLSHQIWFVLSDPFFLVLGVIIVCG